MPVRADSGRRPPGGRDKASRDQLIIFGAGPPRLLFDSCKAQAKQRLHGAFILFLCTCVVARRATTCKGQPLPDERASTTGVVPLHAVRLCLKCRRQPVCGSLAGALALLL